MSQHRRIFKLENNDKFHTVFSIKNLKGQYCLSPFVMIDVDLNGQVSLCGCSSWLPTSVGNLFESSLEEILSSPKAVAIRQSIIDGTYQYCNEKNCGIINNNQLIPIETVPPLVLPLLNDSTRFKWPNEIQLAGDKVCNLSCPSCRTEVIKVPPDRQQEFIDLGNLLSDNLFSRATDEIINLTLSTTGELFASPMLMAFVGRICQRDFPNLTLSIQTNGLMCEKNWHRLNELQSSVSKLTITIDAAHGSTYKKLRRGGNWFNLIKSMEFLSRKKKEIGMTLHTRMVVQRDNVKEMLDFYNFSKQYDADRIEYVRLLDNNQIEYKNEEFLKHDVFNPNNPEYHQAISMLQQVKNLPHVFFAGGLN